MCKFYELKNLKVIKEIMQQQQQQQQQKRRQLLYRGVCVLLDHIDFDNYIISPNIKYIYCFRFFLILGTAH